MAEMLWTCAEERLEIYWTKDAECGDAKETMKRVGVTVMDAEDRGK